MRWTDVAAPAARRTITDWRDAMRGLVAVDVLDRAAERASRGADAGVPIVLLAPDAYRMAWDHVVGSRLERGGLLLGEPLVARAGDLLPVAVFLRAAVPGRDDDATEYSLRLQAGVWNAARAALVPGEVVVGWFHSHPAIGAFFSGTDRRTQAGFFHHPFSVGWVIDPVRREHAWFVGPQAQGLPLDAVVALA